MLCLCAFARLCGWRARCLREKGEGAEARVRGRGRRRRARLTHPECLVV
eukprot:COSAG06_NODE_2447_length_6864_cov_3.888101_1_plen_49_part_00